MNIYEPSGYWIARASTMTTLLWWWHYSFGNYKSLHFPYQFTSGQYNGKQVWRYGVTRC